MRVALFPLSTVLFPQGVLPLRVFEARYLDMVRDCMREGTLFGVCLITDSRASEVSRTTALAEVGCLARIDAWDMKQLGLLHIRAVGQDRFRLLGTETQADGLVLGDVELIDPDDDAPVPPEHRPCVDLLSRILDDLRAAVRGAARARRSSGPGRRAGAVPVRGAVPHGLVGVGLEPAVRSPAGSAEGQADG